MRIKFLILVLAILPLLAEAQQDLLRMADLSRLRIDLLTDDDVIRVKQQLVANKLTIDQVRPLLLSKGLSASEYEKLTQRLQTATTRPNTTKGRYRYDAQEDERRKQQQQKLILPPKQRSILPSDEELLSDTLTTTFSLFEKQKPLIDPRIFGAELFNPAEDRAEQLGFQADLTNLATPLNYEIGPGDGLKVVVFGKQEYSGDLTVSREGNITIPGVGQINVGGLTIEAGKAKVRQAMLRTYPTLGAGTSKLNLTLGETRTIRVTVVGANRSGSYNISSLASVYAALSVAGGPLTTGSFRQIELIRDNKIVTKVDLYNLLVKGDQSSNLRLRDNDVIRIPSYECRVELSGQVKRVGLYEALPGESFSTLLSYAGGFDDTAYTASVKLIRKGERERLVRDVAAAQFATTEPQTGDHFIVGRILDRYSNRLKISGAVFRPDIYEWVAGLRVADLVNKADGLREDAFLDRAVLIRQRPDLTREMLSIDLGKALTKDPHHDLLLQKEDELLISSKVEMTDSLKVTLLGEVHVPGDYHYITGMTLKALILNAGGFTDASSATVEVAHLIIRDTVSGKDTRSSEIERVRITDTLTLSQLDIVLRPYDVITVRKKPTYTKPETVLVVGQVQFPGPYALGSSQERVSDLFKRAGGALPDANIAAAYIKRFKSDEERKRIAEDARRLQLLFADSSATVLKDLEKEYNRIPLNLEKILIRPGTIEDVVLQSRDELIIPRFDAQVRVSGAVLQSTQIPFNKGAGFRYYISSAGGYARDAWRKSAYVIYANGKSATARRFFFINSYPKVLAGAEIIVPKEPITRNRLTTGEVVGLSSALASLAGVVIALLRL
ncbi:MAG: sugar transporter [Chitinophagales bacterium]|nr:sugar transporter [Chitinophagales bacterium]